MARKRGVEKVVYELEGLLLHSSLSASWLRASTSEKVRLCKALRKLIRMHCVEAGLMQAVAQDIFASEGIATETHLYQYVKRVYYRNNTREMLIVLQTVLREGAPHGPVDSE